MSRDFTKGLIQIPKKKSVPLAELIKEEQLKHQWGLIISLFKLAKMMIKYPMLVMVGEEDDLIHFWQEWKFIHFPRQFGHM